MTVATTPSSSPIGGRFILQPPPISSAVDSDGDVQNAVDTGNTMAAPVGGQHPITEHRSRQLVDLLLDEGERRTIMELVAAAAPEMDGLTTSVNVPETDDAAVSGWERAPALTLKKPAAVRPRRRPGQKSSFSNSSLEPPVTTENSSAPPGGVVRCISEDYVPGAHSHRRAAWKSNVEPGTYRYIVNNGIYRSAKFASLGGDWVTAKRSRGGAGASSTSESQSQNHRHSVSSNGSSNTGPRPIEVRHRQSLIRRDLNRYTFLNNGAVDATNKRLPFEHSTVGNGDPCIETPPSTSASSHTNQLGRKQISSTDGKHNHQNPQLIVQQKQQDQQQEQQQQQQQQQLPPPWSSSSSCYSRPDTRDPKLVKSVSDLFVENFSSKIDALEKEDPISSATPEGLPRPGTNPAVAVNSLQASQVTVTTRRTGSRQHHHHHHLHPRDGSGTQHPPPMSSSSSVSDRSASLLQADDISRDLFTVKPAVGIRAADQLPLKPLEKLTPQLQKKAQKGKLSESLTSDSLDGGAVSDARSGATSSASHHGGGGQPVSGGGQPVSGACPPGGKSSNSTPRGGAASPPELSTSFMTAMNAFSQIHHQYHLRDAGAAGGAGKKGQGHGSSSQHSKSSPPTFRSTLSNGSNGSKNNASSSSSNNNIKNNNSHRGGHHHHHNISSSSSSVKQGHYINASDTDSLSSVKNALTLTNNDIEKMRMNHLAVRDYTRYISTRPKPQLTGLAAKPPVGNRKTSFSSTSSNTTSAPPPHAAVIGNPKTLGLRPFNTTSAPLAPKAGQGGAVPAGDDLSAVHSDSDSESFLAGTSLAAGSRGVRERGMSLPEISGKRLSVTTTNQRML